MMVRAGLLVQGELPEGSENSVCVLIRSKNLSIILDFSHFLTPYILSASKSGWLCILNMFRIQLLLTTSAAILLCPNTSCLLPVLLDYGVSAFTLVYPCSNIFGQCWVKINFQVLYCHRTSQRLSYSNKCTDSPRSGCSIQHITHI